MGSCWTVYTKNVSNLGVIQYAAKILVDLFGGKHRIWLQCLEVRTNALIAAGVLDTDAREVDSKWISLADCAKATGEGG